MRLAYRWSARSPGRSRRPASSSFSSGSGLESDRVCSPGITSPSIVRALCRGCSMSSPLSPSESLGLAGAALEARVRRATSHISDINLARIAERLAADARTHDMLYDHEGKAEVIRIMLRPLIAMPEQLTYVHHVCLDLIEALERLPHLYLEDPRIREILAVTEEEEI